MPAVLFIGHGFCLSNLGSIYETVFLVIIVWESGRYAVPNSVEPNQIGLYKCRGQVYNL